MEQLREWVERFADRPDLATTHVDVHEYFDARDAALRAHASQVPPDSAFFYYWPNDLLATVWPTETTSSSRHACPTELPESDLFAGSLPTRTPLREHHPRGTRRDPQPEPDLDPSPTWT